jgi:hypothetical protein
MTLPDEMFFRKRVGNPRLQMFSSENLSAAQNQKMKKERKTWISPPAVQQCSLDTFLISLVVIMFFPHFSDIPS